MTPGRLPALLVVLLLGLVLGACGSDDGDGGGGGGGGAVAALTPQRLALVADRTTAKGGVRMSLEQTMTIAGQGSVPATAEGRFDTKSQRGEMTMTMDLSSIAGEAVPGGDAIEQQ